jgi:rhodanese-related sulfurtransferase
MRYNFLIFSFVLSISVFGCDSKKAAVSSVPGLPDQNIALAVNMSTDNAKKMMAENKDLVILDVRTPGEVSAGIIPNAKVIDINNPDFETLVAQLDKSKPTLVYCKAGSRSKRACDMMAKLGFKSLYNLEGGYDSWK